MNMLLLFLFWTSAWFPSNGLDTQDNDELNIDEIFDEHETRSRLLMINGNMFFHAGTNKNITFRTSNGGSVFLHETNISNLPELAVFQELVGRVSLMERVTKDIVSRSESNRRSFLLVADIAKAIIEKQKNTTIELQKLREWRNIQTARDVKMRRWTGRLMKNLKALTTLLSQDACISNPCQQGGTCITKYGNKYTCLCPITRTGTNCEQTIDYCSLYSNTTSGCQNNGTCENGEGGVLCHCSSGYHGPLCQYKVSTCSRNIDLCGSHGHCIDTDGMGEMKYKCLCEWGFRPSSDLSNPTCIDVNECESNPCHPGVTCINLPGTFKCSGCPKGYQGNGQYCVDIDECSLSQYPCSLIPRVKCVNTPGSYRCSPCPVGYSGDGHKCSKIDLCSSNICHPEAKCIEDLTGESLSSNGVLCQCPIGSIGDGIGIDGCDKDNSTICQTNNCLNGATCQPLSSSNYRCNCPIGYLGTRCERPSACLSSPCQNGATCATRREGRSYFCSCEVGFYGTNCELEEDSCGVHNKNKTGTLLFPDDFRVKTTKEKCDVIIAPEDMNENESIQLRFLTFANMGMGTVGGGTNCSLARGNVTLFDGISDQSHLLAVFCGDGTTSPKAPTINQPITMTSSYGAMLRYQGEKDGRFKVSWVTVPKKCGYRTPLQSTGFVSMPSFEGETSCEWFIQVPMDKHIELTIPTITMPYGVIRNCDVNRLEIFDGFSSELSSHILELCESSNGTQTIRTTGPWLTVAFKVYDLAPSISPSDNPLTIKTAGWAMKYDAIEPQVKCGGKISWDGTKEFSGIIESPNFGSLYYPNSDCSWSINALGGIEGNETRTDDHTLKIEFISFDVPGVYTIADITKLFSFRGNRPLWSRTHWPTRLLARNCVPDYVRIYEDGKEIADLCNGNRPTLPIYTKMPQAIVTFHSNGKDNGAGFQLQYSLVCEKRFTSANGSISPSNYPNPSNRPFKCTYIIETGRTKAIRMRIKYVGLRDANTQQCFFNKEYVNQTENYIELSGGLPTNAQINTRYICPKYPFITEGTLITSGGRPMKITYSTDGSHLNTGFLIEYDTFEVGCGGVFSGSSGQLSSPNYPEKYLPHMHCVYTITVPYNKRARLSFDNFELEVVSNDECSFDHVKVYDTDENGELLGRFCGTMLPPPLFSSSNKLMVVFESDRSVAGTGFSAKFESITAASECDRTFTSSSGVIVFNGTNTRNVDCDFHIAVSSNMRVLLTLNSMNIPCRIASLTLRNGMDAQSPGFHTLYGDSEVCNEHPFKEIRSHGSRVFLKLKTSDPSTTFFNISYEVMTAGCGGHIAGYAGSLAAPQYPQKDSRSMDCEWNIAVALGSKIRFSLAMIDDLKSADENGFCGMFANNALDILDGPHSDARLMRRVCKKEVGIPPLNSEGNQLTIRYRQQGGLAFGSSYGFLAHFTTICTEIVLTSITGSIQSPGYPDSAYGNRYCTWNVIAPPGNKLQFTIHKFVVQRKAAYIPPGSHCSDGYLKLNDDELGEVEYATGNGVNISNTVSKYCTERMTPLKITTSRNTAHWTFGSTLETNQFWMSWRTIGCGGELHNGQKVFVRKSDLDTTSEYLECNWIADAGVGKQVKLKIEKLGIFADESVGCKAEGEQYSGLGIYYGTSNSSGFPQKVICDQQTNYTYVSHISEMFIKMKIPMKHAMAEGNSSFFTFQVEFVEVDDPVHEPCTGIIEVIDHQQPVVLHSPNYPLQYPRGVFCQYLFETKPGYSLHMTVTEFSSPNYHPQQKQRSWNPPITTNLTCQAPLPSLEGALIIYGGNSTNSLKMERLCLDISTPIDVHVPQRQSLVTFTGASVVRTRLSGEDDDKKKIGFVLLARAVCGGLVYAEDQLQSINIWDLKDDQCNITIRRNENDENGDDRGIYLRIDEAIIRYTRNSLTSGAFRAATLDIQIDGGEWQSRTLAPMISQNMEMNEYRGDREINIGVNRAEGLFREKVTISYSTDIQTCGGELSTREGTLVLPSIKGNFECEWKINHFRGSSVILTLDSVILPKSESCADSYLEIRKQNSSGQLIGRYCQYDGNVKVFIAESFWLKLRYNVEENTEEDRDYEEGAEMTDTLTADTQKKAESKMILRYFKKTGGTTNSSVVEYTSPAGQVNSNIAWKIVGEPDKALLIHFEKLEVPDDEEGDAFGLYMTDSSDDEYNLYITLPSTQRYAGWEAPTDVYLDYSVLALRFYSPPRSSFKIVWKSIPKRDGNTTEIGEEKDNIAYNCGQVIIPSNIPQYIESPGYSTKTSYGNDLKCKWTFERPLFRGIKFKIIDLDLEGHNECRYDYIAFVAQRGRGDDDNGDDIRSANKMCDKSKVNRTIDFTYNKIVYLHFRSDHSRSGRGFRIEYQLTCNSFDYIKSSSGLLNETISSFNYPAKYENDKMCHSSLVLESNRRVNIEVLDLDMEGPDEEGKCTKDWLYIGHKPPFGIGKENVLNYYCGGIDQLESARKHVVTPVGRVFFRMSANKEGNGKGYQLRLTEQGNDCSADELFVDEKHSSKILTSPFYPKLSPNSLDCSWIISSPNGHRLKFTVDPHTFDVQSSGDECGTEDYLEIRDGPTEHSKLVGKYCKTMAPSTVYSTGNYLFVRYVTDVYAQSAGFSATYELATCGGTVVLRPGVNSTLTSPSYPDIYPPRVDCQWLVKAPNTHFVEASVDHVWLSWNANCSLDHLAIRDGNETDSYLMTPQCSSRLLQQENYRSSSSMVTVQFHANNTFQRPGRVFCANKKCGFEMGLKISEESCGGIITDSSGSLTTPGYPGRLLSHVKCEWIFKGGIGSRYELEFEFMDGNGFYQERYGQTAKKKCFIDLEVFNGLPSHTMSNFMNHRYFCENVTTMTSSADLLTIRYNDQPTRDTFRFSDNYDISQFYLPFRVNYRKVPESLFDSTACMYLIDRNTTLSIQPRNTTDQLSTYTQYCHIVIRRPNVHGTTSIKFQNFKSIGPVQYAYCTDYGSFVQINSINHTPFEVDERICNSTFRAYQNETMVKMYLNQEIELHVFTQITPDYMGTPDFIDMNFDLTVEFEDCGGHITSPNSGTLVSPNFGGNNNYLPDSNCLWILEAPEGQIVKVSFTDMDIETDISCRRDVLLLSEGKVGSVIHRYCHREKKNGNETAEITELQERFSKFQSRSRFLSLLWKTDDSDEFRGWRADYEFVLANSECGFITHDMTGTIHSPNFPSDYGNDEDCVWDISVPLGYHIRIQFDTFDVQTSENCEKDSVVLSQEHQAQDWAPVGNYYFLFNQEEKHSPFCGIDLPEVFHSESNRIRVNFTSDSKTTAKGFRATWSAECGTIYRLNHGVLTSPHYPQYYPNQNTECNYLIDPETEGIKIVTLKMLDFDLSPAMHTYNRNPCDTDYVEVRDLSEKRVVHVFCANEAVKNEFPPLSIKGAVGIRFVTNSSFLHSSGSKMNRGFKLSYALSKCGDTVVLGENGELLWTRVSSPGYPLPYHENMDCVWNITAPADRILHIKWEKLDLEVSGRCDLDYVEVIDGKRNTTMGKYCGNRIPSQPIRSTSNSVLIRFVSDRTMQKGGFSMYITATLGVSAGCGGTLKALDSFYELKPPVDQNGLYFGDLRCAWTIKSPRNSIIEMKLTELDTENLPTDCPDSLTIFDGFPSYSPQIIGGLCSSKVETTLLPLSIHSSHDVVVVQFDSDYSGSGKGFTLQYKVAKPDCGGWYTATSERTALNYESTVSTSTKQRTQRCQFVIRSTEQQPIMVTFSELHFTSPNGDCSDSFLEIRDAGTLAACQHPACAQEEHEKRVIRYCGDRLPATFISKTMAVQITTSGIYDSEDGSSFNLEYQLLDNCNRTVDARVFPSGRLTSPNYPQPYEHNSTCVTEIQTDEGKNLLFVFRSFHLERGRIQPFQSNGRGGRRLITDGIPVNFGCEFDSLEIREPERNSTGQMCSASIPPSVYTRGPIAEITLRTDSSHAMEGYDMYYYSGTTKGNTVTFAPISELQGAVTNIGYPGYNDSLIQIWTFSPPIGHLCTFELNNLDLGLPVPNKECSEDEFVEISYPIIRKSGLTVEGAEPSTKISKCQNQTLWLPDGIPFTPTIDKNLRIKFQSDDQSDNNGVGFRITWNCENYIEKEN